MQTSSTGIVTRFGALTPNFIEPSINAAARMGVFDPDNMPLCAYGSMYYLENSGHEATARAIGSGTAEQAIWRFHRYMREELEVEPSERALLPDPLETAFSAFRNDPDAARIRSIVGTDLTDLFRALGLSLRSIGLHVLTEISIRPQLMTAEGREEERIARLQRFDVADPPIIVGHIAPPSAASDHDDRT